MNGELSAHADFEEAMFDMDDILEWAQTDTGGGLPYVSAQPFASWLDSVWSDYDDGTGDQTNEDVLKGALSFWTGRG